MILRSVTKQRLCRFLFAAGLMIVSVCAWAQTGNRYALVIGNADYQRIGKLKNTIADAEDISTALKSLGYQVDLKRNLGHLQMVDAVEAFVTKLAGNRANEGFFWYAGHAVQIRDENYLLPVDITVDSESRVKAGSYSLNSLIEALEGARNKVNVLILDACRDNPLPPSGRSAGGSRGLALVQEVPSDLFIMFSTAPGDKADDGAAGKRNSPFAEAFLKYIKSTEPVYQMAIDVTQETLALTGQRQRPFQRGSIISEKYYSLNPAGKTGPVVVPPVTPPSPAVVIVPAGRAKEHFDKGLLFFERKDWDNAVQEFSEALKIDPNYKDAYFKRGDSYNEKKDYDRAIADFTQAIKLDPNDKLAYKNRGNAYFDKQDYDSAFADYNQAIRIDPNYPNVYNNRGNVYRKKGDYDRALADYNQAIKLDPNFLIAYLNRGSVYYDKGDDDRAIADFTQVIKLDPNYAVAYKNRGNAYHFKNEYDSAIADYNQAIKLDPNDASAYFSRGNAYYDKKQYDRAIADYNQAIKLDPNYSLAYFRRGDSYDEKEDYNRAIADFTQAIKLNPNFLTAFFYRGLVYRKKGDYDRAIADFTQAIKMDPNYAAAYYYRGLVWEIKGDKKKADLDFDKAKQLGYK